MVFTGGLQAAFAKIGVGRNELPYEPYVDPEPQKRLRRTSSHVSMRPRKPSIVQSACLSVHKIPAIVAASGSPDIPSPRTRPTSVTSSSAATRNYRHSISGWHQLLSSEDIAASHAYLSQSARPNADAPIASGSRADRSYTVPAAIDVPASFDFRDLDQHKPPYSAPSQETTFRLPDIQVTTAERPSSETSGRYTPQPISASYDFVDMDLDSPGSFPTPRPTTPSASSIHRSPSPAMGQSYRSVSPTVGHAPYYSASHRRDSPLRTSHNESSEYGVYYCASPVPISASGSAQGTSRGNTCDPRRGDPYGGTRGGSYISVGDTYDPTRPRGGLGPMTSVQPTRLMEDYNRDRLLRPVPTPARSPTDTVSDDGTIDSPYNLGSSQSRRF